MATKTMGYPSRRDAPQTLSHHLTMTLPITPLGNWRSLYVFWSRGFHGQCNDSGAFNGRVRIWLYPVHGELP